MPRKKVIDQVLKLLALAESSTHAGEINSARQKAEELLLRHEIALGELSAPEEEFARCEHDSGYARAGKYRIRIADMVACFNGTYLVYRQEQTTRYILYGRHADVTNTIYMYGILVEQMQRARRRTATELRQRYGRAMLSAESNGFCAGFCNGVQDKLTSLTRIVEDRRQEAGLVPLSAYAQLRHAAEAAYLRDHKVGKSGWRGSLLDREHFDHGYRHGSQASIHRGVAATAGKKRLCHTPGQG
jgi:hypothetical protein